jgi:TrmH family RNA methyltransferase
MTISQRRSRLVKRLRVRKTREREGRVLVEGVRAVDEALESGAEVDFAVVSPRLGATEEGIRLARRLSSLDVVTTDDRGMEEVSDTDSPQGVLAVCREPAPSMDALEEARRVLVLDALQDPGNLGTLVRSAVAFGFDGIVCLDGTVDPWGAKAVRASAGMVFRLPLFRCTVQQVVDVLARSGTPLFVASSEGSGTVPAAQAFALVVGNEGSGVRGEVRAAAAKVVAVSMSGPAESLNAGIAGSILMYLLAREGG